MDYQKLNKLSEYVKNTTSLGIRKSGDLLELSRLALETRNLEKNLKAIYMDLGELCYKDNKNKKTSDESYKDYFNSIEASLKKIDHLNKKILKIKDMKLCRYCNKKILKSSLFCPACGEKL